MGIFEGIDFLGVFKENSKVLDFFFNKYVVYIFDLVYFFLRIFLIYWNFKKIIINMYKDLFIVMFIIVFYNS